MDQPTIGVYTMTMKNKIRGKPFKKGRTPWNKGTKGIMKANSGSFKKGSIPWNKGKKTGIKPWLGKKRSIKDRIKMGLGKLGNHYPKMSDCKKGKKLSEMTKKKMSESAIKHMNEIGRTKLTPNIGKQEKKILDSLELIYGFKIKRQFRVGKYFVDGYTKDINLVIEIDENYHHKRKKEYDLEREKFIIKKLNCKFWRIII